MTRNRPAWRGLGPELRQYFADKQWIAEDVPLGAVGCTWHELAVDYEVVSGTLLPPPPQWTEGRERGYLDSLSLADRSQQMRAATLRLRSILGGGDCLFPGECLTATPSLGWLGYGPSAGLVRRPVLSEQGTNWLRRLLPPVESHSVKAHRKVASIQGAAAQVVHVKGVTTGWASLIIPGYDRREAAFGDELRAPMPAPSRRPFERHPGGHDGRHASGGADPGGSGAGGVLAPGGSALVAGAAGGASASSDRGLVRPY